MEKNTKNYLVFAIEMSIITIAFIILLMKYDVQPIGPQNSEIGLASLNGFLAGVFTYSDKWYHLSQLLGYAAFGVCGIYAIAGLIELIQRKSIAKVDRAITVMGLFYLIVLVLYFFFNKFAVNYRPIILDEVLEPSFPSSHTMLVCCVFGMAIASFDKLIENVGIKVILDIIAGLAIGLMVLARTLSGVHWFTDIFAGILFSITIVAFYHATIMLPEKDS
ncbi:MAG: phosphatase PAP2 family protein [Clostridia bacterium]|nr:phosphatase PAP2 family protein [Clostridia bacterium]